MNLRDKVLLTAIVVLFSQYSFPFTYTITFTGSGAGSSVESVLVENLTKKTSVTVPAGNTLLLTDVTTALVMPENEEIKFSIYPVPLQNRSDVRFFIQESSSIHINIYDLAGRLILNSNRSFQRGENKFQVILPYGIFIIKIKGENEHYQSKVISKNIRDINAQIIFSNDGNSESTKVRSNISLSTTMYYSSGDQLLFKGISGNFSTLVADKPSGNKTINFGFVQCMDADGYNYTVVKIGNQVWMAENLRTLKFRDGTDITRPAGGPAWLPLTTSATCWYNEDATQRNLYGSMYNYYAIVDTHNICPVGWHIPTNAEWVSFETAIGGASTNAPHIMATKIWFSPPVGTDNSTGFSALPGGYRQAEFSCNDQSRLVVAMWWSLNSYDNNNAWATYLNYSTIAINRTYFLKKYGMYVRCVKD